MPSVNSALQIHPQILRKTQISKLYDSVFDIQVSRGGLSQAISRLATRIDPTYEAMKATLPTIRAVRASGDFDEYWEFHLAQEHARNHEARYAAGQIPDPLPSRRSHLRSLK